MKTCHTLAAIVLGASFLLSAGCSSGSGDHAVPTAAAIAESDQTPVRGREAVLTVYGMSCPLCANNVDKTLLQVPGVQAVRVDMGTGRATVTLDGTTPVTRGQLARAVDRSGFSLQRIEAP